MIFLRTTSCRNRLRNSLSIINYSVRNFTESGNSASVSIEFKEMTKKVEEYFGLINSKIENRGVLKELEELNIIINQDNFWDNSSEATKISQKHGNLNDLCVRTKRLQVMKDNAVELATLAAETNEPSLLTDCVNDLIKIEGEAKSFMAELLLDGPIDSGDCFLEVSSGAGGVESCDFTRMLFDMYLNLCKNLKFTTSIVDYMPGQEAGIKSGLIKISGLNAYGWLRTESGAHRLVRCSPFDSQHRRHTSFAQVAVLPVLEKDDTILLEKKDLRIDTFKSSGPGGQSVNTTDSAVRIVHIPSGLEASCQSERSQHTNKQRAMELLRSKLFQVKIKEEQEQNREIRSEIGSADFGNQIRSYVLQPYQMVKDHRTNEQTANTKDFLDGKDQVFLPFLESALLKT